MTHIDPIEIDALNETEQIRDVLEKTDVHVVGHELSVEAGVVPERHRPEAGLVSASHGTGYCRRGST